MSRPHLADVGRHGLSRCTLSRRDAEQSLTQSSVRARRCSTVSVGIHQAAREGPAPDAQAANLARARGRLHPAYDDVVGSATRRPSSEVLADRRHGAHSSRRTSSPPRWTPCECMRPVVLDRRPPASSSRRSRSADAVPAGRSRARCTRGAGSRGGARGSKTSRSWPSRRATSCSRAASVQRRSRHRGTAVHAESGRRRTTALVQRDTRSACIGHVDRHDGGAHRGGVPHLDDVDRTAIVTVRPSWTVSSTGVDGASALTVDPGLRGGRRRQRWPGRPRMPVPSGAEAGRSSEAPRPAQAPRPASITAAVRPAGTARPRRAVCGTLPPTSAAHARWPATSPRAPGRRRAAAAGDEHGLPARRPTSGRSTQRRRGVHADQERRAEDRSTHGAAGVGRRRARPCHRARRATPWRLVRCTVRGSRRSADLQDVIRDVPMSTRSQTRATRRRVSRSGRRCRPRWTGSSGLEKIFLVGLNSTRWPGLPAAGEVEERRCPRRPGRPAACCG